MLTHLQDLINLGQNLYQKVLMSSTKVHAIWLS